MSREKRKEIISRIEDKRKSKVISYITSDREGLSVPIAGDVSPIIHQHILDLKENKKGKFDFLIYSRGGQSDVPWTIVSMFREYSQKGFFSVLIPYKAHSAATAIALGADEIVMTKKAELGPIDITIGSGPYNPIDKNSSKRLPISVEDVTGYFSLLKKVGCTKNTETMKGFELITNHVHPLALGNVNRLLEETKLVALRLLSTRAEPFNKRVNEEIVKKISSEVYSHSHTISRTEALKYMGLKQVIKAEDIDLSNDLWELYDEYKDLFCLEDPFKPEEYLFSNDLEENIWKDLNLACIESLKSFDICKVDMRVRKLRQVPPQVNLNLQNVDFPTINIPSLPTNFTPQQIDILIRQTVNSVIQESLNNAASIITNQFIKSLPQAGFERFLFNGSWRKE
jgi:ClpP class serine protease